VERPALQYEGAKLGGQLLDVHGQRITNGASSDQGVRWCPMVRLSEE
jgi:hypothetical protein